VARPVVEASALEATLCASPVCSVTTKRSRPRGSGRCGSPRRGTCLDVGRCRVVRQLTRHGPRDSLLVRPSGTRRADDPPRPS
jgi:hypothetical protein